MNIRTTPPMDKATFYRWLERQERRHELVDGRPRMLPFVTSNHSRITTNIVILLGSLIDRQQLDITAGDYAIETGERSVRFADIMVMPYEPRPDGRNTTIAPLVVEVLSERTAHVDFGEKLSEYTGLEGVNHYLVFAHDRACAWSWRRDDDNTWHDEPEIVSDLAASVEVPALGLALPMADVYRGVPLRT